jgi:hypothetical protein
MFPCFAFLYLKRVSVRVRYDDSASCCQGDYCVMLPPAPSTALLFGQLPAQPYAFALASSCLTLYNSRPNTYWKASRSLPMEKAPFCADCPMMPKIMRRQAGYSDARSQLAYAVSNGTLRRGRSCRPHQALRNGAGPRRRNPVYGSIRPTGRRHHRSRPLIPSIQDFQHRPA